MIDEQKIDDLIDTERSARVTKRLRDQNAIIKTSVALSPETRREMKELRLKYNLKPRDVVNSIIEDHPLNDALIKVAGTMQMQKLSRKDQTTIAISRAAQLKINKLAKDSGVSRDAIIAIGFQSMLRIMDQYREKEMRKHESAMPVIDEAWGYLEKKSDELKSILGEDDPVYERFGYVIILMMNLSLAISNELRDGTPVDPDDFSQSC